MSDYNERAARSLEEEHGGELSFTDMMKYHFTRSYWENLRKTWRLKTLKNVWSEIKTHAKNMAVAAANLFLFTVVSPIAIVTAPVWWAYIQIKKLDKNWTAYKAYKQDKEDKDNE